MILLLRKLLLVLVLIQFNTFFTTAQTYGNEWINYNQKYYSFPVVANGLKRINYTDLENAGIPVSTLNHSQFQIFGKKREVPLWIETNGDNSFDPGDYILFYAEKNDGWLDSTLYLDPEKMANHTISLVTDTLLYFFSWSNSTNNRRFTAEYATDYLNYAPASYVWSKVEQGYTEAYHEGEKLISGLSSSFYVAGEGYGKQHVNGVNGYNLDISAPTPLPYVNGPDAKFRGLVTTTASAGVIAGNPNHHTRWLINGQTVYDETGVGCFQFKAETTFPSSGMSNVTDLDWQIVGDLPVATMYQALTYWSIEYPRLTNFGSLNFIDVKLDNGPLPKTRLDVENFGVSQPVYFSIGSQFSRLFPEVHGATQSLLVPKNQIVDQSQILAFSLDAAQVISTLTPVNGTGIFTNFANLNHDKAYIIVYHPSLYDASVEYKNYRQSMAGGSKNVVMANVEELYLQYAAGVRKHVNGIRYFALHSFDLATNEKPEALFLLGKGLYPSISRSHPNLFAQNLIPTFGSPPSDILITSNLPGTTLWKPLIPTGRLSVTTEGEIMTYLDKIMVYDQQQNQSDVYDTPNKDWQKHVIHLVGGVNLNEQILFNLKMNSMKATIERDDFGAKVHTIRQSTTDPIPPNTLQEITDRISQGVSMMTYYGHKGITNSGFEINIDEVQNWNNTGKYPLMLVNSCYNGDIFQVGTNSSSEYFVNTPNLGAIGYISAVSVSYHPYVGDYSNELYRQLGKSTYRSTIAQNMAAAIQELQVPSDLYMEVTATQMTLNGDPAIVVNSHDRPEIELLESNISFGPSYVDLNTDSLEMSIALKNLGRSIIDTFNIEVVRDFPGTTVDSIYHIQRTSLHYVDTIKIKFPLQAGISTGLNLFTVKVDIPSFIPEQYDEINNNQVVKSYFLNLDGILPVVPYEFAVVPDDTITLKASTINPLAEFNTYRFQIDTTDLFNSPFLKNAVVSGLGGVKEVKPNQWNTPLVLQDSMVYFWRVAVDGPNPDWKESSFQYIRGKSGWGQDHFFQFKKNSFQNVHYNRAIREREWIADSVLVNVDVFPNISLQNAYFINGTMQDYAVCSGIPPLHVAVIDPLTFEAWGTNYNGANPDHDFGNTLCRSRVEKFFIFYQNSAQQLQAFQNMVLNEVPDGHYLLIYAPITADYTSWNQLDSVNMYQTFAALGSDSIIPGRPNRPFAFFTRKGYHNTVVEQVIDPTTGAGSENNYASIHMNAYMPFSTSYGAETSTLIGPALKWKAAYWQQQSIDPINNADTTRLILQPYTWDFIPGPPINILFSTNDSMINLTSQINAEDFPYMKLRAVYVDSTNYTPAQVDSWHILYDLAPEAAVDGSNGIYFSHLHNSIFEGETLKFAVDIKNIFTVDMDSLLVNYWVVDNNNVRHPIAYPRQEPLLVGDVIRDTISFSTYGLAGFNSLWVEANPYINGQMYVQDQPEQHHFNNVLQFPFRVADDRVNPLLDVTFDGRHILNGDIVNPNAEILITLKDENPYMIMDNVSDTSKFGIYLKDPSGNLRRIPFVDGQGNMVMQWIPAESSQKRFKIIYPAAFKQDGKYTLLVQGTDRSGNLSGDNQYKIMFEVIQGSSITHMMNYPNPFSTSTRFVFTLTGTEVPEDIIIQIMTVSGRVVREITEDQLGRIYIGRNVTEYAWDGRDEFGDQLANGVYLYTVKAKLNGEDIEHRESGADKYFKKSFGKMYLMR